MEANQHNWRIWAGNLHRWGIDGWMAAVLEAAGPLTVLGAQLVYIGKPLLQGFVPGDKLDSLALLLEDTTQTHAFIALLREEAPT
jgi:hypothetical protein